MRNQDEKVFNGLSDEVKEKILKLKADIERSRKVVFFGGAGVSTESGIPDFRSTDGLYHQTYRFPPETILSHTFFMSHTAEFYEFYKEKIVCPHAEPNVTHLTLARMEAEGKLNGVVTQNIDDLHRRAGSKKVYELHGSAARNFCMNCGRFYDIDYIRDSEGVPRCSCGGVVKPDVVLYEEGLDDIVVQGAIDAIEEADMIIVGGTSLAVYPAAGLLRYFGGSSLVLINKSPTPYDSQASLLLQCGLGNVFANI